MRSRLFLLSIFILCTLSHNAQSLKVEGVVFYDKNGNGIQDRSEKGIKRVAVSNGDTVVMTDSRGYFTLPAQPGESIFPVLPTGYGISATGVCNTGFHYIAPHQRSDTTISFPLIRIPHNRSFRLLFAGDIQVDNEEELGWTNQTLFTQLANRNDIQFMITPGDLVNDNAPLLHSVRETLESLPFPVWTVPGNHDRDTKTLPRDFSTYNQLFGAENYAFFYGNTLFIALNNIITDGKSSYYGGFTNKQLNMVRQLVQMVPERGLIVVCQHIPMNYIRNRDTILSLLSERKILILSGHTHTTAKYIHSPNCCELVAGAVCGSWWRGEKNGYGIPAATQSCGAPRNYFLIDFFNNSYRITFQPIDESTRQMDIWIYGENTLDLQNPEFESFAQGTVLVNIFAGCAKTRVYMRIDHGMWQSLEHTPIVAPNVSRIIHANKVAGYPTAFSTRIPLRRTPSPHIWRGVLSQFLSPGTHTLTIKAEDEWGVKVEEKKIFTIW